LNVLDREIPENITAPGVRREFWAAPLVRADAPDIKELVNALFSGMPIMRRIDCPWGLGAAGAFLRWWRGL
jgi:hypothetical protein